MRHLAALADGRAESAGNDLVRATGRFYTSHAIADHLIRALWASHGPSVAKGATVRVCDPFAGDGRLVIWLIEHAISSGRGDVAWDVSLWDLHAPGLQDGRRSLTRLGRAEGAQIRVETHVGDAFMKALTQEASFDVVITNPPWENLKPDRRELQQLTTKARSAYVNGLREYDLLLGLSYPLSQPERKFAGWGTNLARVGVEMSLRLAVSNGCIGIVTPASLLADDSSAALRQWMLSRHTLLHAAYVPAEARQFPGADVSTASVLLRATPCDHVAPRVTVFDSDMAAGLPTHVVHPPELLRRTGYVVPISFGVGGMEVLQRVADLPRWVDLEESGLWAGRELDETGIDRWLDREGAGLFVKGRMIERLGLAMEPSQRVSKPGWRIPPSVAFERLVWRDVSRPSQKRRVIATLVPPSWIAGNSLGVAHFRTGDATCLRALLAVMCSCIFEFQLRCFLATGHVSLSALRKVHIPDLSHAPSVAALAAAATAALEGNDNAEARLEAVAARAYGITRDALERILVAFEKIQRDERQRILAAYDELHQTKPTS